MAKRSPWLDRLLRSKNGRREYQRQKTILQMTDLICSIMQERGISRRTMAKKTGRTVKQLDAFLDGQGSLALWMLADVFMALGMELKFSATGIPKQRG